MDNVQETREVDITGTRERCPFRNCTHPATQALVTGPIRGVACADHHDALVRDHQRALRYTRTR